MAAVAEASAAAAVLIGARFPAEGSSAPRCSALLPLPSPRRSWLPGAASLHLFVVQPIMEQLKGSRLESCSSLLTMILVLKKSVTVQDKLVPVKYRREELLEIKSLLMKDSSLRGRTQRTITSAVQRSLGTHLCLVGDTVKQSSRGTHQYQFEKPRMLKVQCSMDQWKQCSVRKPWRRCYSAKNDLH